MPFQETAPPDTLISITRRRAEVLRLLGMAYTHDQIAIELGVSKYTIRRHVAELLNLTGSHDGRELGRWWVSTRMAWLDDLAKAAGCPVASSRP